MRINDAAMEVDERIVELGAKLDEGLDGNLMRLASQDRTTQAKALLRGFDIVKELDRVKADGLKAITALLNRHDQVTADRRAASLIHGFEFGAKLAHSLHDELLDADSETKVLRLMDAIVQAFDKIGSGRAALAVLLNHPDAGVRVSAATYLIDLMPERVVPILREIDEKNGGNSADFTGHWALLAWERERKSRFNYLSK
jgi:hypothetical protein